MPSLIVHALVPPLVLLAVGLPRRQVLWLWPLTLAQDLDHFVGVPRASLHNLLVLVPPLVGLALAYRDPATSHRREWYLVAFAYLASHLVMDAFNGGWTPFFPLVDFTFLVTIIVWVRQPENVIDSYVFEFGTHPGPPTLSAVYPFLSPFEVAMAAFALLAFATAWGARRWKRRAGVEGK